MVLFTYTRNYFPQNYTTYVFHIYNSKYVKEFQRIYLHKFINDVLKKKKTVSYQIANERNVTLGESKVLLILLSIYKFY